MKTYTKDSMAQGDILIVPDDSPIPAHFTQDKPENGKTVLAHGEVTGHHHAVPMADGHVFRDSGDPRADLRLVVERPTVLRHQEHPPIDILPGRYKVMRQIEYVPNALPRPVLD